MTTLALFLDMQNDREAERHKSREAERQRVREAERQRGRIAGKKKMQRVIL